jgi:hypothetical protein
MMVLFDNILPQNGAGIELSVFFKPAQDSQPSGGTPRMGLTATRRSESAADRRGAGHRPFKRKTDEMQKDYRALKAAGLLSERRNWSAYLPDERWTMQYPFLLPTRS